MVCRVGFLACGGVLTCYGFTLQPMQDPDHGLPCYLYLAPVLDRSGDYSLN